jgi:peptidylprolyl isomerase
MRLFPLLLLFAARALADISAPAPSPADLASPSPRAQRTPSGLTTLVLRKGTGTRRPAKNESVLLHYSGYTTDGKMIDSSIPRGQPATFPLSAVIPGFAEGVGLMVVGEKRRMWIPPELGYQNKPGRPQGTLVFDVELIAINPLPSP